MTPPAAPVFHRLTGLYEPSAIVQLPDGRFLVAEDEKRHPFTLLRLLPEGGIETTPLLPPDAGDEGWKFDDLEGLTLDTVGRVCAITSHSLSGDGEEKKARSKLLRFAVAGDRAEALTVCRELKPALTAVHPVLAAAAGVPDVKAQGGLNIEALEFSADGRALLLGLRSPQWEGQALIACLENPEAVFSGGVAPRFAPALQRLDLGGHGIRALSWVPALAGYLLVSGPAAREGAPFLLWFWEGRGAARPVSVPGLPGFEHAEGVCPALLDGQPRLLIVSDDGDRKARRPARYLLLDTAQLRIG